MPYIAAADRPELDTAIEALAEAINGAGGAAADGDRAGRLNYAVTRLANLTLPPNRYARAALVTGVLDNVKTEMYRRAIAPYEDTKVAENGDVREYRQVDG